MSSDAAEKVPGRRSFRGFAVPRIEAAIRAAERGTSAEIRVALSRWYFWGDVRRAGERAFFKLGMHRTPARSAILIFVAPWRRRFVILPDLGLAERVKDPVWGEIAARLAGGLRTGDPTAAVERAIAEIGEQLAAAFPPDAPSGDPSGELPDEVVVDP